MKSPLPASAHANRTSEGYDRYLYRQRLICVVLPFYVFFLAVCLFPRSAVAQERDERTLKSAFVFNLTKYVEWPSPKDGLAICFVGEGPMGESLETLLQGKSSESRVIHVVLFPKDDSIDQCDVLYIGNAAPKKVRSVLDRIRSKSVLSIADSESFPKDGGMVALVRSGQQIQMQINLEAVQDAKLKISSRVLNLATIIHAAPEARN